jgi:hypothetical protein
VPNSFDSTEFEGDAIWRFQISRGSGARGIACNKNHNYKLRYYSALHNNSALQYCIAASIEKNTGIIAKYY